MILLVVEYTVGLLTRVAVSAGGDLGYESMLSAGRAGVDVYSHLVLRLGLVIHDIQVVRRPVLYVYISVTDQPSIRNERERGLLLTACIQSR